MLHPLKSLVIDCLQSAHLWQFQTSNLATLFGSALHPKSIHFYWYRGTGWFPRCFSNSSPDATALFLLSVGNELVGIICSNWRGIDEPRMKRSITVFITLHFPTALPISCATSETSLFEKAELIGASTPSISLSLHRTLTQGGSNFLAPCGCSSGVTWFLWSSFLQVHRASHWDQTKLV